MSPSHAVKKGVRYRYYVSTALVQGRKAEAGERRPGAGPGDRGACARRAARSGWQSGLPEDRQEQREHLKQLDLRVDVGNQTLEITWASSSDEEQGAWRRTRLPTMIFAIPNASASASTTLSRSHNRRRDIILPTTSLAYVSDRSSKPEQESLTRSIAEGRQVAERNHGGHSYSRHRASREAERTHVPHDAVARLPRSEARSSDASRHITAWRQHASPGRRPHSLARSMAGDRAVATRVIVPELRRSSGARSTMHSTSRHTADMLCGTPFPEQNCERWLAYHFWQRLTALLIRKRKIRRRRQSV